MKKNSKKGFTVLELAVVIAIFGLLASIVLIAVRGSKERAEIASKLQTAASFHHILAGSLVGEWKFNEGSGTVVADTSGNGNNATASNCAWVDGAAPALGKALDFNGSTSVVKTDTANSSLNLAGKSVTISAWVKFDFNSLQQGSGYRSIYDYNTSLTAGRYTLYKSGAEGSDTVGNKLHMRIGNRYINGNTAFSAEKWYFLVGTWDNSKKIITVYVDGKKDNEGSRDPTWSLGNLVTAQIGAATASPPPRRMFRRRH